MKWLNQIIYKHPVIVVILVILFAVFIVWWFGQPIQKIYNPAAPPFPYDLQDAQGW